MSDSPVYTVVTEYTQPQFRRAAKAYMRWLLLGNKVLLAIRLAIFIGLAAVIIFIVGVWVLAGRDLYTLYKMFELVVWLLVGGIGLAVFLHFFVYYKTIKNCERLAKKMSHHKVTISFDVDTVRYESDLATSTIKWKHFLRLQKSKDIWLLYSTGVTFFLLPIELMSPEAKTFILDRLTENQVPIRAV